MGKEKAKEKPQRGSMQAQSATFDRQPSEPDMRRPDYESRERCRSFETFFADKSLREAFSGVE